MGWVAYLFGSGAAYFLGIALIVASLATFTACSRRWLSIVATVCAAIGILLVILSATPLPYWLYALAGATTILWLLSERLSFSWLLIQRKRLRLLIVVTCTILFGIEVPFHFSPKLRLARTSRLYVIGDSVSAGVGDGDATWPEVLAHSHPIEVTNLAQMGATAKSALHQAQGLPRGACLVVVEIGGNDLLGATSTSDFEYDLDQLLGRICVPENAVAMFELPLPPLANEYGSIQRRLASKHDVKLIPKRVLMAVLTADGATLDSIHLSRTGHERMAQVVWDVVGTAYDE